MIGWACVMCSDENTAGPCFGGNRCFAQGENMEAATNHAYRALVDERIHQLLANRRWYRANLWAHWSDLRREDEAELRALLKIARAARKMGRETGHPLNAYQPFISRDPIDEYKATLR